MKKHLSIRFGAAAALLFATSLLLLADIAPGQTVRVSTGSDGSQGSGTSSSPLWISADGRYVAFYSDAPNFIQDAAPGFFLKDLSTGGLRLVEKQTDRSITLSEDLRYAVFASDATLLAADTNDWKDIYVKDLSTGQYALASTNSGGVPGNGRCESSPVVSADGRFVAFVSQATDLAPGDTNGALEDVFVKDLQSGAVVLASTSSNGTVGDSPSGTVGSISSDGRFVAFNSYASNLVAADTNDRVDAFVKDLATGATRLASTNSAGTLGNDNAIGAQLSRDGRYIAWSSFASNLVEGDTNESRDIFVKDLETGVTRRVSVTQDGIQGDGGSLTAQVGDGGRFVCFHTLATNLGGDVLVKDLTTGALHSVSVSSEGVPGNGSSYSPRLSANGSLVAFASLATNLVSGDTNGLSDVFVRNTGLGAPSPTLLSAGAQPLAVGKATAFVAYLKDKASLQPLPDKGVRFFLDNALLGEALTDEAGKARLSWSVPEGTAVGTYSLKAKFMGDGSYAASMRVRSVEVQKGPVRVRVYVKSASPGSSLYLTARLLNASGSPLAGRTLSFKVQGVAVGTAVTNANGVAARRFTAPSTPGAYELLVEFQGDAGHTSGSGTGTLMVG
ncbi:MAG TPA: Ig-like domain repeat protein [Fimbriimonas sp.]